MLQLKVKRTTEHGVDIEGELNLVDLAGSERISVSGVSGARLQETQAINTSLSALGDVVAAMASGDTHIPFRNSKLTHLLQKHLASNDSKVLMFINVSPFPGSLDETINSLRFASKVWTARPGGAPKSSKS